MQRGEKHSLESRMKISRAMKGRGQGIKKGPWSESRKHEWLKKRWPHIYCDNSEDGRSQEIK